MKTSKDLSDGHLWYSVVSRPAGSPFTSVQRVSCCFSLLLCTMLTSLMFYGIPADPSEQTMDLGTVTPSHCVSLLPSCYFVTMTTTPSTCLWTQATLSSPSSSSWSEFRVHSSCFRSTCWSSVSSETVGPGRWRAARAKQKHRMLWSGEQHRLLPPRLFPAWTLTSH